MYKYGAAEEFKETKKITIEKQCNLQWHGSAGLERNNKARPCTWRPISAIIKNP